MSRVKQFGHILIVVTAVEVSYLMMLKILMFRTLRFSAKLWNLSDHVMMSHFLRTLNFFLIARFRTKSYGPEHQNLQTSKVLNFNWCNHLQYEAELRYSCRFELRSINLSDNEVFELGRIGDGGAIFGSSRGSLLGARGVAVTVEKNKYHETTDALRNRTQTWSL